MRTTFLGFLASLPLLAIPACSAPGGESVVQQGQAIVGSGFGGPSRCALEGTCVITLASGVATPVAIAVDSANVYWADNGAIDDGGTSASSVMETAIGGASAPIALASGLVGPTALALVPRSDLGSATAEILFTEWNYAAGSVDSLTVSPTAGGPPSVTTQLFRSPQTYYPNLVAVDTYNVYWAEEGGEIVQAPMDGPGTDTEVIAYGVYAAGLAVDATWIYWTNLDDGTVSRSPIGFGADSTTFVGNPTGNAIPEAITTYGGNVYFLDTGTLTLWSKSASDLASPSVALATVTEGVRGLAVDASGAYWLDVGGGTTGPTATSGTLYRVPIAGGERTVVADGLNCPSAIALDANNVYWTNAGLTGSDGSVMQVKK